MSDEVIAKKLCNFLIKDAEADFSLASEMSDAVGMDFQEETTAIVISAFKKAYGGLWVGGSAHLTRTELRFTPNAMNRLVHKGDCSLSLPLTSIVQVDDEFGFFTRIISIATKHGVFKMRCYGATKFREAISMAVRASTYLMKYS